MADQADPYAAVAAALAAVDPSGALASLKDIEAHGREIAETLQQTKAELADIGNRRRMAARNGPDTRAAADALMRGDDVEEALAIDDRLEQREEALNAGVRGLRERGESQSRAREAALATLRSSCLEVGEVLYPQLLAETKDLASRLGGLYATVVAAEAATGHGALHHLARRLGTCVAALNTRYTREEPLMEPGPLRPDPRLIEALENGATAVRAARRTIRVEVEMPRADL